MRMKSEQDSTERNTVYQLEIIRDEQPVDHLHVAEVQNEIAISSESQNLLGMTGEPSCQICGDRGSGFHYSVYSCEGCKGFFKRTVQKNLTYACRDMQNCTISKLTRNACQFCRYRRCLTVGMKREAVREDRTPGGKHRHKRQANEDNSTLVYSHDLHEDSLMPKLIEANPDITPSLSDIFQPGTILDPNKLDVNDMMQFGYMELRYIIEWARKVPGFSDLEIEDQMALLKASFIELNVLRLAYRSLACSNGVMFADGLVLSPEHSLDMGWGQDLVKCTLEFISRLQNVHIDQAEFCVLSAIVLTYPDTIGLKDRQKILELQSSFLDSLRRYTVQKYATEPRRYGQILLRLPALRAVSAKTAEKFLSMTLDSNVKMNALVLEIMS